LKVDLQDCHLEIIRQFAILIVAKQHADEFIADIDFSGIIFLRPFSYLNGGQLELHPQILGKLCQFFGLQLMLLMLSANGLTGQTRKDKRKSTASHPRHSGQSRNPASLNAP
jgi:hypothetical protein